MLSEIRDPLLDVTVTTTVTAPDLTPFLSLFRSLAGMVVLTIADRPWLMVRWTRPWPLNTLLPRL
jgi:hypothetical protein